MAVDATAVLQSGLDALTGSYHYVSTVTVDGAAALTAEGDRVGDGSRLTLTSSDGTVNYVITADGSWVMPEGGRLAGPRGRPGQCRSDRRTPGSDRRADDLG